MCLGMGLWYTYSSEAKPVHPSVDDQAASTLVHFCRTNSPLFSSLSEVVTIMAVIVAWLTSQLTVGPTSGRRPTREKGPLGPPAKSWIRFGAIISLDPLCCPSLQCVNAGTSGTRRVTCVRSAQQERTTTRSTPRGAPSVQSASLRTATPLSVVSVCSGPVLQTIIPLQTCPVN